MSQRVRLVEQLLLPEVNRSEVIESFNVSAKTAYKWLARYEEAGIEGLSDRDKTPQRQPLRATDEMEEKVVQAHQTYPYWGPKKLHRYLTNENLTETFPSHTTIGRILKRRGCQVIRSEKSSPASRRFERTQANELWQMDFKGSFMTKRERCYPLTIVDDFSRYSIGLQACEDEKSHTVKTHLTEIFRVFGLPWQINVDNGNPWGRSDLESHTSLMIWLAKLGIRLSYSAPYHPQTNGKAERFHRTLKLEVLHEKRYGNNRDVQYAFDRWQHIYNFKRPHESLEGQTPSSRYRRSLRAFPEQLQSAQYSGEYRVKRVHKNTGTIYINGNKYRVGKGLCGEDVELRETKDSDVYAVFFMDMFIKKIHLCTKEDA